MGSAIAPVGAGYGKEGSVVGTVGDGYQLQGAVLVGQLVDRHGVDPRIYFLEDSIIEYLLDGFLAFWPVIYFVIGVASAQSKNVLTRSGGSQRSHPL